MIRSITVTNDIGESLKMELSRPELSGFVVMSIKGLGPDKATINVSEISTTDGSIFNSARVSSRNIVISLRFLWKPSIEEVRHLSYKYFPLKKKITLLIETDNRLAEIEGYVESNEPDIFSNEEGSDISVVCPNPFFRDASGESSVTFGGIEPMFEFPFSNESLVDALIELSAIRTQIERTIVYEGDADAGVTMHIRANGPVDGITIYDLTKQVTMKIDTDIIETLTGSGIVDGDEIVICTITGKKSATLIREGNSTDILNAIDKDSTWFKISKGLNTFAYATVEGRNNMELEIRNDILYEGV